MFDILKDSLRLCAASGITSCIWGHRGIGKSESVAQLAMEGIGEKLEDGTSLPIGLVDFRCSQLESSDIRGLPDKVDGRTVYLPPSELPVGDLTSKQIHEIIMEEPNISKRKQLIHTLQPRYEHGILFLDEPNRAEDDVLQAFFQLIYDRKIGQYVLPDGWAIIMACNYMEGGYMTNGFVDAAFLDRMCHLNLEVSESTLPAWADYLITKHGESSSRVIEFCSSNPDHLLGSGIEGKLGFEITPSPRSWDRVVRVEKEAARLNTPDTALYNVLVGLVGHAGATSYRSFKCPIQPRDILQNGIKKYEDKLKNLDRCELLGVVWGFGAIVRNRKDDDRAMSIALDMVDILLSHGIQDKDVVVSFCRSLVSQPDLVHCITHIKLGQSIVDGWKKSKTPINETCLFLTKLVERPELHQRLSTAGWGK